MLLPAGLSDIAHLTRVPDVAYADFKQAFFLHDLLASGVSAGEISRADATAFVEALERREQSGTFLANAIGYAVAGTRLQQRPVHRLSVPPSLQWRIARCPIALRRWATSRAMGNRVMWT